MASPQSQPESPLRTDAERNATILTFAYDRWFRWTLAVFVVGLGSGLLFIAKIHVASTPEVKPPYRISYLDRVQARSLIRSAQAQADKGAIRESLIAWQSAAANNPANLDIFRGTLRTLLTQSSIPKDQLRIGYTASRELLKRTGTNLSEFPLVARFNSTARLHELNIELLRPLGSNQTAVTTRYFAEALFQTGAMDEFGAFYQSHTAELSAVPELGLLIAAWKAAWGPPAGMQSARDQLVTARKSLSTGSEAARMLLKVAYRLDDIATYRDALGQLTERHEDQALDHVLFWNLLTQAGKRSEAIALAQTFGRSPENAPEAAGLAEVFDSLGMTRFAADFSLRQLPDFAYAPELWVTTAELFVKLEDWNQVRELAIRLRNEASLRSTMSGYSWYLEGLVDLRLNRPAAADENFAHVVESGFSQPRIAAKVAAQLRRLDRPKVALALMKQLEKEYGASALYWFDLASSAYESRDMETTTLATAKAYAMDPTNDLIANNHAAVLIATETKPDEALALTLNLVARKPRSVDLNINHCLALINAGRLSDAEARLLKISPIGLTHAEQSVLNFAWFRIHASRTNGTLARRDAAAIDRSQLMSPQIDRLERDLKSLP